MLPEQTGHTAVCFLSWMGAGGLSRWIYTFLFDFPQLHSYSMGAVKKQKLYSNKMKQVQVSKSMHPETIIVNILRRVL